VYQRADNPLERLLALHALGRGKADLPGRPLRECLQGWSLRAAPGSVEPSSLGAPVLAPYVAATILLDAGVPKDERLALADENASLEQLVDRALASAAIGAKTDASAVAWQLQLLALASASGIARYRAELGLRTESALSKLERDYRALDLHEESAARDRARVEELARAELARTELARTEKSGAYEGRARELQLSAAVFLASAVNPDPHLDGRIRRHLQSLLVRYDLDRAVYRQLLAQAGHDPQELRARRAAALEQFGRLGQALFMAHLAARQSATDSVPAATARVMRQTAGEIVLLVEQLATEGAFDADAKGTARAERAALLEGAVQALRGLRSSRAAVTS
jgi:hypothetical protein